MSRAVADRNEQSAAELAPDRLLGGLARHWLALANVAVGIFAGLPVVAPALMAAGLAGPASVIYGVYSLVCHQWPFRSYFLFGPQPVYSMAEVRSLAGPDGLFSFIGSAEAGFKLAYCERDVAIYTTIFLAGLAYALVRHRVRPLGWLGFGALILPLALDGTTQLLGWRESTWELRTITGILFALASVWLVYPRFDLAIRLEAARRAPPAPALVVRS